MITILYIDDDLDDIDFFEDVIQDIDPSYTVHAFDETPGAIEFLENTAVKPDIIFLDINMPKLSGREALMVIRRMTQYAQVPIVMFSTTINDSEKQSFIECGATALLRKGYAMEASIHDIESILKQYVKKD